jgi:DNA-binding MarR family transcriptional regulator
MNVVEPAPHEFTANFMFDSEGLAPFFACDRVVKDGDGSAGATFEYEGEPWSVTLSYRSSNIVNPGETTPQGTEFKIETIREYKMKVRSLDDDVGERDFYAHIAPRWQGMEGEKQDGSRTEISVPEGFREGVNVHVEGSNIEFSDYLPLLQHAFGHVGVNRGYFYTPHEFSNVQDAALYVRLHRDDSGPIHARDGPLVRLAHLLEHDRQGYRKLVQNDDDERGNTLPGFYHTVTLGEERIREAFPGHEFPKEVKHYYYNRNAKSRDESDPLAHPKLEASFQTARHSGRLGVSESELAELRRELEETVLSVVNDSEVSLQADDGDGDDARPYVGDAYFTATNSERDVRVLKLNLSEIETRQENIVVRTLAKSGGLSPVEWSSLETLVTDGGEVSPQDIAESGGFHRDSVYRALDRIDEIVEREYGKVSLRSTFVAELVHDAIREARESTRNAVEAAAKTIHAAERGVDEKTSAFLAWASRYCENVSDRDGARMKIRLGDVENTDEARRLLRMGFSLWEDARQDIARFRSAEVRFSVGGGRSGVSTAWRFLDG